MQFSNLVVFESPGPSVLSLGPLVPWSFGPLVLWSLGPPVPWSFRPLVALVPQNILKIILNYNSTSR